MLMLNVLFYIEMHTKMTKCENILFTNDRIGSEFYRYTVDDIGPLLGTLFNSKFEGWQFPRSWGDSVICPIYKSGITCDPSNYHGISITTSMYNPFSTIITSRLYSRGETNNTIKEALVGFRTGYSVIDNVFLFPNYGANEFI